MPRHGLGEFEQMVLLALLRLGEHAYGASIRAEILARTGRSITPGAIYPTLDRLEQRGLVTSHWGEPTHERGGRSRRHFAQTRAGTAELRRAWRQTASLAQGLEAFLSKVK
jgi:PadR family transcriptional regulator, regulatory protein PadR